MALSWIGWVGFAGVAVVLLGWLVVSFSPPGPRRTRVEWVAALGLYVALLMLFVNLFRRALEADSMGGLVAFGFLATFFGAGLVVCTAHTLLSLRPPRKTQASATN